MSDVTKSEAKAKVFISYSRKDLAFTDKLDAALKARGFEPLIDREEIYAFEDWWQRIQSLITQADTIIFVLSPDAVASDICRKEVEFAASLNKRFAPVVCKRVDDNAVPAPLRRFNYIFADDDTQFEARMELLAQALETDIEWIRKHTEFGALARTWEIAGSPGPRGLLLRSPTLDDAERWIASRPPHAPEPTPMTRAFITESRRAAKQQRVRALLSIGTVTLVVGIAVAAWFEREYLKLRWDLWRNVLPAATERAYAQKPGQEFRECSLCPFMVVVPAGEFMMGSPETETERATDEDPQHKVKIARSFAVGKFELTFVEWEACVASGGCGQLNDNGWGRGNRPVSDVSWNDAQEYVAWLSKLTGQPYRLLSEAEWEYSARAQTALAAESTRWSFGNDESKLGDYAWYSENSDRKTQEVGKKLPNAFGLHDMHGNVWEWVEDCDANNYNGTPIDGTARTGGDCSRRVLRGGSGDNDPENLRSADRYRAPVNGRYTFIGFRVARTLQ